MLGTRRKRLGQPESGNRTSVCCRPIFSTYAQRQEPSCEFPSVNLQRPPGWLVCALGAHIGAVVLQAALGGRTSWAWTP